MFPFLNHGAHALYWLHVLSHDPEVHFQYDVCHMEVLDYLWLGKDQKPYIDSYKYINLSYNNNVNCLFNLTLKNRTPWIHSPHPYHVFHQDTSSFLWEIILMVSHKDTRTLWFHVSILNIDLDELNWKSCEIEDMLSKTLNFYESRFTVYCNINKWIKTQGWSCMPLLKR